jgi:hypothetical protein
MHVGVVHLLVEDTSVCNAGVKLDPGRCQHEVNMACKLIPPKFDYPSEVELAYHIVRLDQCVHIRFEPIFSVYTFHIKLYLDEAIWVRPDDKVDFCPVDHDHLLDIIHNFR